ncbi:alpha/beta fold hydrolase [Sphaerisporangium album]|nr:alpha/beta hydrolase [Sphaerisporangium album]
MPGPPRGRPAVRRRGVTAATALVFLLALLLGVPSPAASSARAGVRLEEHPCPVAVPAGTRCGYLVVPERRDVSGGQEIRVGYAVHRSTSPGRRPDPVVYSSGGPGSASLQLTGYLTQMSFGADRDVVVIEQRGGRWSLPRLDCPEIARALLTTLTTPGRTGDPAERAGMAGGAAACKDRLTRQGVDLRGYVSAEIAADVVDLRRALGYARWNLFGVSYSTRTMLMAAAADPQGTRSVVLDSFWPEGTHWYDRATAKLAGTLARLGRSWPGLPGRFAEMVRALDRTPARLETSDPLTGRPLTVVLNGDDVATVLTEAMHEVDVLPVVPALVDAVAGGDHRPLQPLADQAGGALLSHEFGLYYAVMCQDEAPANTFAAGQGPRLFTVTGDQAVCDAWRLPASPARPSVSGMTAPVLVVGGEYDPATPPADARTAAAALPAARFTEFAGVGHAVFLSSRCGRQTISAFVENPAAQAPCDPRQAEYKVWRPGELYVTPVVYRLSTGTWLPLIPFVLFFVASAAQLVAGLLGLRRGRGRRISSQLALTTVAGLAGVAFTIMAATGVYGVAAHDETVLAVGVPTSVLLYGTLAAVSAVLALAVVVRGPFRWCDALTALVGVVLVVWWFVFL